MRFLLKAACAFAAALLLTGHPLSPRWNAVAMELHQAQPQAQVKRQWRALFHHGED